MKREDSMTNRVNHYFQQPASPEFVRHMIEDTGFSAQDKEIVRDLRQYIGDTELHAQTVRLPVKLYNERVGKISVRLMDELFRLAQIGYLTEKKSL